MLIEKLINHLENISQETFQQEWEEVKEYENVGPLAVDIVNLWRRSYFDDFKLGTPGDLIIIPPGAINFLNETPEFSEFFFNIELWKINLL